MKLIVSPSIVKSLISVTLPSSLICQSVSGFSAALASPIAELVIETFIGLALSG